MTIKGSRTEDGQPMTYDRVEVREDDRIGRPNKTGRENIGENSSDTNEDGENGRFSKRKVGLRWIFLMFI